MVAHANGEYKVTVDMFRRGDGIQVSTRTILKALTNRKIFFLRLREKPLLTGEDVNARFAFARKYNGNTAMRWNTSIDMHIDAKHFPVLLHGQARSDAARKGIRGSYRIAGQGLRAPYMKRGKRCQYNTSARAASWFWQVWGTRGCCFGKSWKVGNGTPTSQQTCNMVASKMISTRRNRGSAAGVCLRTRTPQASKTARDLKQSKTQVEFKAV